MSHHSQLATTPRYLISSTLVVSAAAAARARDWRWLGVPRVTTLLRDRPRGRMATWIDAGGGQQVFGEQRARVSTIRHGLAGGARWQLCTAETPSGHKFVMIDVGVITKRWSRTQVPLLFLSARVIESSQSIPIARVATSRSRMTWRGQLQLAQCTLHNHRPSASTSLFVAPSSLPCT